jgi:hypothetical protein
MKIYYGVQGDTQDSVMRKKKAVEDRNKINVGKFLSS